MKNLCKASEEINKKYIKMTSKPRYICEKCGRVAKKEKVLCKALKIKN